MENIIARKCPDSQRKGFLFKHCGNDFIRFEQTIFATMERFNPTYDGGYWNFLNLSNGGFYMSLESDESFPITQASNYFDDVLSADALSIGIGLYVLNMLAWKTESKKYIDAYYSLRDFACEHKESAKILAFID